MQWNTSDLVSLGHHAASGQSGRTSRVLVFSVPSRHLLWHVAALRLLHQRVLHKLFPAHVWLV